VNLIEIPIGPFASLVRQILLEDIQQVYSLLMQFRKLLLRNTGLARCHMPVHALDENVHYLVNGVSNMRRNRRKGL
jgi:hypothetical protein